MVAREQVVLIIARWSENSWVLVLNPSQPPWLNMLVPNVKMQCFFFFAAVLKFQTPKTSGKAIILLYQPLHLTSFNYHVLSLRIIQVVVSSGLGSLIADSCWPQIRLQIRL